MIFFTARLRIASWEPVNGIPEFSASSAETGFRQFVEDQGIVMADLVHPVRIALTGSDVGPGLFETMEVLGRGKTIQRLRDAVE